jgi:hypothetical protein
MNKKEMLWLLLFLIQKNSSQQPEAYSDRSIFAGFVPAPLKI